jgi:hypothetical protein
MDNVHFRIRFTLSPASGGGRQNKARCVQVTSANAQDAVRRVTGHYAAKGRNPQVYAVEIDGEWRKIGTRRVLRPLASDLGGALNGVDYEIGAVISRPSPIEVETPAWAATPAT